MINYLYAYIQSYIKLLVTGVYVKRYFLLYACLLLVILLLFVHGIVTPHHLLAEGTPPWGPGDGRN
jgi:hypothetical protein